MAVKMLAFLTRKEGLSREEFRDLYENRHSRIGMGIFGHLWKEYRRNYLGSSGSFAAAYDEGNKAHDANLDAPFDVVTEFVFESWDDLEEQSRIAQLPEISAILAEDEETLFDRAKCYTSVCETLEEDLAAARAQGKFKNG